MTNKTRPAGGAPAPSDAGAHHSMSHVLAGRNADLRIRTVETGLERANLSVSLGEAEIFRMEGQYTPEGLVCLVLRPSGFLMPYSLPGPLTYSGLAGIDPMAQAVGTAQPFRDPRGSINPITCKGVEVLTILATNAGFHRGGHSHPYDAKMFAPFGSGRWTLDERSVVLQQDGQPITIGTGQVHRVEALTPLVLIEMPPEGVEFSAQNDSASRRVIDDLNAAKVAELAALARKE